MSVKEGAGCMREGAAYGGVSVSLAVVGRKLPLDLLSQVMDSVNQMAYNCFISQKPETCGMFLRFPKNCSWLRVACAPYLFPLDFYRLFPFTAYLFP